MTIYTVENARGCKVRDMDQGEAEIKCIVSVDTNTNQIEFVQGKARIENGNLVTDRLVADRMVIVCGANGVPVEILCFGLRKAQ